jgi:hypothetical protein
MSTRGLFIASLGLLVGCSETVVISPKDVPETSIERLRQDSVERIDILLAIDNSRGMDDKLAILAQAIPDLLLRITNPLCISEGQPLPPEYQPVDPFGECPPGSQRELNPIFDIHLAVVTSSLGGHGSDACEGDFDPSENDHGWLVDRDDDGGTVPTVSGRRSTANGLGLQRRLQRERKEGDTRGRSRRGSHPEGSPGSSCAMELLLRGDADHRRRSDGVPERSQQLAGRERLTGSRLVLRGCQHGQPGARARLSGERAAQASLRRRW